MVPQLTPEELKTLQVFAYYCRSNGADDVYTTYYLSACSRDWEDGITFFDFKINWDRYEDDHTPSFQIEFTIFNLYNHLWIYQNNYKENNE